MSRTAKRLMYVVGAGGAPMEYVLPRLAAQAEVHAFLATPVSALQQALLDQWCAGVVRPDLADREHTIVGDRVGAARRHGVDGIITVSELTVITVAEACRVLGIPGPGRGAKASRDKWLMRKCWAEAGLPVPRFCRVDGADDLKAAMRSLSMPFLLKPAGRGGGIGQQVIDRDTEPDQALRDLQAALELAERRGIVEYSAALDAGHCVAEEIIDSTTESWYDDPRYGDYLSVEGVVAKGVYHPVCITARMPTLANFAETVALSPCVLPERLQRKVEQLATDAVNALRLDTCGTHTELKLMAGERMCLLESAARFAGSTATAMAEAVFGVNMIELLAAEALGEPQDYPERMLVAGDGAAATSYLFGADSSGRPWAAPVPFRWADIDWQALVSPTSRVEIIPSQMPPNGTVMQPYHAGEGALNNAGAVLVYSPDAETVLVDSYQLVDGLEAAIVAADRR